VVLFATTVLIGACASSTTNASGGAKKIAFLLPESKTARYETKDRPLFEAKVKALCGDCEVLYRNADQDAAKQQSQAEAVLASGADVLVLDAVDPSSAKVIVAKAAQQKVPVIAYGRSIADADVAYFVSFDSVEVGQLQGAALVEKLKADGRTSGTIVMIDGAPTDPNAGMVKTGAHRAIDGSGFTVGREYDTPDWSPDQAQAEMDQAITALGRDGFVGVLAANDGTAGGAIAAMKGAGVTPIPPVTGQDAELAAIQRILTGEQYMTVYLGVKVAAETTATVAVDVAHGRTPDASIINTTVSNGRKDVPAAILKPVAMTRDNVRSTVVADGFWTPAEICTDAFKAACEGAGLGGGR
jgi:D-xylose transport system substrate-binding protein